VIRRSHTAAWIMLVSALAAMLFFLQHFLAVAALAVLTVIIFNPLYRRLRTLLRNHSRTAATLTVLSASVLAVIPIVLVAILSYFQALTVFAD
jgi:predicted PurR-regulated permease PerM